jgi:CRP-like cAMP-binding protein
MIYSLCKKRQYQNGESILQEGIPGSGLYIIDKGQVTVTKQGKQGKDIVLATVKEGGHFGEMSLLNDEPTSASVVSSGDVAVYLMERKAFFGLLDLNKSLSNKILRAMCEELSNRLRVADLFIS